MVDSSKCKRNRRNNTIKLFAARIVNLQKYFTSCFCYEQGEAKLLKRLATRDDFLLDPNYTFLNHGSYGAVPQSVFTAHTDLQRAQENDVDGWFQLYRDNYHRANITEVAKFVGANETNLVFVENATTGLNNVIKSLDLAEGDALLVNSHTYSAIVYTCEDAASAAGATVLTLEITQPLSSIDEIVQKYSDFLQTHSNVKFAVIDHISSGTATLYPLAELITVCKQYDVLVCIDGAHAPGQVNLNLEELGLLGMDFYVGNLHKWAYACRGAAILWVHPNHHSWVRPVITSYQLCYPNDDFRSYFVYSGTQDRTELYTATAALQYIESKGGVTAIVNYNTTLLTNVIEQLIELWGPTTYKFPLGLELEAPCMRLLKVPTLTKCSESELRDILRDTYLVKTAVVNVYGIWWFRLSANIYNTTDDYVVKLGNAILELM